MIKSLCVFCAARDGDSPEIVVTTRAFGALLAKRNISIVYGGGGLGLMGALADGCLDAGGRVVGVIPESMVTKELAHPRATEMHVVQSMAQRKTRMMELADAYCALPGGIGTLDELFEVLTAVQLKFLDAPIGLLNSGGFWDSQIAMLDMMVQRGFLFQTTRDRLLIETDGERLVDRLSECARDLRA